jgi:hypothetical protein
MEMLPNLNRVILLCPGDDEASVDFRIKLAGENTERPRVGGEFITEETYDLANPAGFQPPHGQTLVHPDEIPTRPIAWHKGDM